MYHLYPGTPSAYWYRPNWRHSAPHWQQCSLHCCLGTFWPWLKAHLWCWCYTWKSFPLHEVTEEPYQVLDHQHWWSVTVLQTCSSLHLLSWNRPTSITGVTSYAMTMQCREWGEDGQYSKTFETRVGNIKLDLHISCSIMILLWLLWSQFWSKFLYLSCFINIHIYKLQTTQITIHIYIYRQNNVLE